MRRLQLVEIEDLPWCPRAVRNGGTDWLAFMANASKVFSAVAPKIRSAMDAAGSSQVVDLCSGAGGPWPSLQRELAKTGPCRVVLTDLFPNREAVAAARVRGSGTLHYHAGAVDAANVPPELEGVRTIFNAFHHFPPDAARRILADAVRKRRPIAIFEGANSRAAGLLAMPMQLPLILLLTPAVSPFRWSRLVFTYALPLIPLLVLFDGTVSFLRLYLEEDLRDLVRSVPEHESFEWDIGSTPLFGSAFGLTHLVGVPRP